MVWRTKPGMLVLDLRDEALLGLGLLDLVVLNFAVLPNCLRLPGLQRPVVIIYG